MGRSPLAPLAVGSGPDAVVVPEVQPGGCPDTVTAHWSAAAVSALPATPPTLTPLTLVVNTAANDADDNPGDGVCHTAAGACSLRAAINEANTWNTHNRIEFNIPGAGPHIIALNATGLDAVLYSLDIDGTTQAGTTCCTGLNCSGASWKVILDRGGSTAGGLWLNGDHSTVKGLAVRGVGGTDGAGYAIHFEGDHGTATCNEVTGSWGGIGAWGEFVTIGGAGASDANWAHANGGFGLTTIGGHSAIQGNLSGTSADGLSADGNGGNGIYVEGGVGNIVEGNLASGNDGPGIYIKSDASDTELTDNLVGVKRDRSSDLCNNGIFGGEQIRDDGVETALSGNILGECPPPAGCCNITGLEGVATCVDAGLVQQLLTSQADCQALVNEFGGTATDYNPDAPCAGGMLGSCPLAPTAMPTVSPTFSPLVISTATPTGTPTATLPHAATVTPSASATSSPGESSTPTSPSTATAAVADSPTASPTTTLVAGCPAEPSNTCFTAGRSILQLRRGADPSRRRFSWKWNKGLPAIALGDLGDPLSGSTGYVLCLYAQTAGSPAFMMGATVAPAGTCGPAACWRGGTVGWSYRNRAGNADGLTKLSLRSGGVGKSNLQVRGAGASLPVPAPFSETAFFERDTAVIVQLQAGDRASCWSSTFTTAKSNDGTQFKAKQ